MNKKTFFKYLIVVLTVAIAVSLDQVSKVLAETNLLKVEGNSVSVIDNFFSLSLYYNTGGAWSILSDATWLLILLSLVALGFVIYTIIKNKDKFYIISASIFMGGLIGNLIDRLFRKGVIDFFDFNIFGYNFPVFNVADICIVVSAFMIAGYLIFKDGKDKDGKDNTNSK